MVLMPAAGTLDMALERANDLKPGDRAVRELMQRVQP